MDDRLMAAIDASIARTDELHVQRVAELERTIAGLHKVLRVLATHALQLADIKPPSDPADAAVVHGVLDQARKVMEFLEPPSH